VDTQARQEATKKYEKNLSAAMEVFNVGVEV
jgi:hypothetical protein